MVYVIKNGDDVEAYGDLASLGDRQPDKVYSLEEWWEAGSCAHLENGEIKLGRSAAQRRAHDEEKIRTERYFRLRECDQVSPMRWNSMSDLQRAAWTQYREELLNVPQMDGFPWDGDTKKAPWPTKPE